jgi:hypothetical protein
MLEGIHRGKRHVSLYTVPTAQGRHSTRDPRAIASTRRRWPVGGGRLGVGELVVPASVAEVVDEPSGLREFGPVAEEAGAVQVDVGEVTESGRDPARSQDGGVNWSMAQPRETFRRP